MNENIPYQLVPFKQAPYIHKSKIRMDWAAQAGLNAQMRRSELAQHALLYGAQRLVRMRGWKDFLDEAKAEQAGMGPTTSDYAYIADFARKLIYKHTDDLSWINTTIGKAPLSTLDLTIEFNSDTEISGPLGEMDQGARTVLTWVKFDLRLEKYVGRFLVSDAARARGRSNIQALTTLKNLAQVLSKKKERKSLEQLYLHAGNTGAATANWDNASRTMEMDIAKGVGTILNTTDSLPPKQLHLCLLLPATLWLQVVSQQATHKLDVVDHFKKKLRSFEIIPTKAWSESGTASDTLQDDALLYIRGSGTAMHGWSANVPFPLVERARKPTVGMEYFFQQWFNTVTIPDSKTTTTTSRIYKITGVE